MTVTLSVIAAFICSMTELNAEYCRRIVASMEEVFYRYIFNVIVFE